MRVNTLWVVVAVVALCLTPLVTGRIIELPAAPSVPAQPPRRGSTVIVGGPDAGRILGPDGSPTEVRLQVLQLPPNPLIEGLRAAVLAKQMLGDILKGSKVIEEDADQQANGAPPGQKVQKQQKQQQQQQQQQPAQPPPPLTGIAAAVAQAKRMHEAAKQRRETDAAAAAAGMGVQGGNNAAGGEAQP